jgi:tetratricopeptide (TPR) repeat protein
MTSTGRRETLGSERGFAVPENADEERERRSISVVTLTAKLAAREAALLEAEWRAEELAAMLDRTQSELAATYARLADAEEKIAAVSDIAEAAQATIDKLRTEVADAEAQASQVVRQRHPIAGDPFRSIYPREPVKPNLRDYLGSKLISRFTLFASWQMPRMSLKRGKPSLITLADRARDAGQWELAARHYRKALNRNPRNSPIWVQYGHALKEIGQMAEAEGAYRRAIELDPSAADPHLQLGHVLKSQRKRNEAVAAYRRALDLDPTLKAASLELVALGVQRFDKRVW